LGLRTVGIGGLTVCRCPREAPRWSRLGGFAWRHHLPLLSAIHFDPQLFGGGGGVGLVVAPVSSAPYRPFSFDIGKAWTGSATGGAIPGGSGVT